MRHWFPKLTYGVNQEPQTELIDKFGGLPWGFPTKLWPNCAECGRPMHFLAQLQDAAPMLEFGKNNVLHAFKCNFNSICSAWSTDSGANAVFVLDKSKLGSGMTHYPAHLCDPKSIEGQSTTFLELRLDGWKAFDDRLMEDQRPVFFDYDSFWALDDETAHPGNFEICKDNKAGPIPYWTGNGPSGRLSKTTIFLQITGDMMPVRDTPPEPKAVLAAPGTSWVWQGETMIPSFSQDENDGTSVVYWANFCSDGTGFFFYEETPEGRRYGLEILR